MILDRLFRRRAADALATRYPGRPVSQTPGWLSGGAASSAGVAVDEERALSLSAVFSAVNRLSRIVAMLPLDVYRKLPSGRKEVAASHPAQPLLHGSANPDETAFQARHRLEFFRLTWGNAYAEIGWDGAARPRSLTPVEPWRVRPERDDDGVKVYRVDSARTLAAGDVVHLPFVSYDGVTGRGWLSYALDSMGVAITAEEFAARLHANDAKPGGLLLNEGSPQKPARDQFREEWQKYHGGVENRGKVGVLWGGWKWQSVDGFSPKDAELLASRKFTVAEVARWLNVPPHLLADLDRATFSNIEQQAIEFVIYCLMSILTDYEQEYNRKLLAPPGLYCKHNVNALLRGDMAARATFYKDLFGVGVLSPNDILDLEDMNSIGAAGEQRFVPVNMAPLKSFINAPAPAANAPAPAPKPEPPPAMRAALAGVLADTFARLGRKELNEARRAAKDPKRMLGTWLSGFYPEFERTLRAALLPACRVAAAGAALSPEDAADYGAALWCKESHAAILAAAECRPEEWPRAAEALFLSWGESGRAERAAADVLEVTHAGSAVE